MTSDGSARLAGKVALITGGSRGIGKAIAHAYAQEDAQVFICARTRAEVDRTVSELRADGKIAGTAGDVGKLEDAGRIVRAAVAEFGAIDILVNNASLL